MRRLPKYIQTADAYDVLLASYRCRTEFKLIATSPEVFRELFKTFDVRFKEKPALYGCSYFKFYLKRDNVYHLNSYLRKAYSEGMFQNLSDFAFTAHITGHDGLRYDCFNKISKTPNGWENHDRWISSSKGLDESIEKVDKNNFLMPMVMAVMIQYGREISQPEQPIKLVKLPLPHLN